MTNEIIEIKATELRNEWGLSAFEPASMKQLLIKLNILTLFRPLRDDFSGMCLKKDKQHFILINSTHPLGRQHFTLAHEFYHLFVQEVVELHYCNPGSNSTSKQEKEADYFASVFLMPEMGLKRMIPEEELTRKKISIATVLRLEQYFEVSRKALLIRLKTLKLISTAVYSELTAIPVIKSAIEYGFDTSLYLPGNEGMVIGDYGIKARKLFDQGLISEGHYIELLSKIGFDPTVKTDEYC